MEKISCIIFDLGGVMVYWNNKWLINEVCIRFELNLEETTKVFQETIPSLSSGKIQELQFWKEIGKKINSKSLINLDESLYDSIFRKYARINEPVVQLSHQLKHKGFSLGLLSNTEVITYSIVEEMISMNHFDYKFLSYKIGYTKPDKRIFHHVLANLPFEKTELLFIDDTLSHVEAALSEGINSIQFSSLGQLIEDLKSLKILRLNRN